MKNSKYSIGNRTRDLRACSAVPQLTAPTHAPTKRICVIQGFSPYRAVNTFRLGYKNQSVDDVQRNIRSLFWDPYKTHIGDLQVEFLNAKPGGT